MPIKMAAPDVAWPTLFGRTNTGIVSSNSTQGLSLCPHFSMSCAGNDLADKTTDA